MAKSKISTKDCKIEIRYTTNNERKKLTLFGHRPSYRKSSVLITYTGIRIPKAQIIVFAAGVMHR